MFFTSIIRPLFQFQHTSTTPLSHTFSLPAPTTYSNTMSAESKLFTTITLDNIREVLGPLRKANVPFYIITAESGYCPACHSDLSSANITAPNSLLGHLRRSKKCIAKREERGVKLFGLKQRKSATRFIPPTRNSSDLFLFPLQPIVSSGAQSMTSLLSTPAASPTPMSGSKASSLPYVVLLITSPP